MYLKKNYFREKKLSRFDISSLLIKIIIFTIKRMLNALKVKHDVFLIIFHFKNTLKLLYALFYICHLSSKSFCNINLDNNTSNVFLKNLTFFSSRAIIKTLLVTLYKNISTA